MKDCSISNCIHVYAAVYPFDVKDNYLPEQRRIEAENCGDLQTAQSKFYSFKLLQIALDEVYGVSLDNCGIARKKNGGWTCDVCQVSISHSYCVAAVALSPSPVGVDVEAIDLNRFTDKLLARILTDAEASRCSGLSDTDKRLYANRVWTVKEAEFKRTGGDVFCPSSVNSLNAPHSTVRICGAGKEFFLTTACLDGCEIKYHLFGVSFCSYS